MPWGCCASCAKRSWPVPPDNGGFLIAAYVIAAIVVVVYAVSLVVRTRDVLRKDD
jgi:hypothetical protein